MARSWPLVKREDSTAAIDGQFEQITSLSICDELPNFVADYKDKLRLKMGRCPSV